MAVASLEPEGVVVTFLCIMFSGIRRHFNYDYDKNIVELFKPMYILLSITGLFSYSIKFPKGKHDYTITRGTIVLHTLGGILMWVYLLSVFVNLILKAAKKKGAFTDINWMLEALGVVITNVAAYVSASRYKKVQVRIVRNIAFIWSDLSGGSQPDTKPILMYLRKFLVVPLLYAIFIFFPVQIALVITRDSAWAQWYYIPHETASCFITIFYCTMVLMVLGLLKNIKNHCQCIDISKQHRDVNSTNACRHLKEDHSIVLTHLETAYMKAIEVKEDIIKIFQPPLTIIVIQMFHAILRESHSLYHDLMFSKDLQLFYIIDRSYWVFYFLAKVFAMTYTGSLLQDEVVEIGKALHSISIQYQNQDLNLLMEIQHFSTIMTFYNAEISFYEFFSLDLKLLFNMVASLVTYLIIMVQFDS